MKINNEAIYATTANPYKRLPWGRCTKKLSADGATLYFHVFTWPADGKLLVPGLKSKVQKAYLLADAKKMPLSMTGSDEGVTISVPTTAPDKISSTVVLEVNGALNIEQPALSQDYDGSITLPASEARLHGKEIQYELGRGRDNVGSWTNANDWADWEFKVTKPGKFEVSAEIAAVEAASVEVEVGNQKLGVLAPATGGPARFRPVKPGVVEISAAGKMVLAVRPVKDDWHPINLRLVKLVPVK
jgi:alpha-L-fucosidase